MAENRRFYALLRKDLFDAYTADVQDNIVSAANTDAVVGLPVRTLNVSEDFYLIETSFEASVFSGLLRKRIVDAERMRAILESGVYTEPVLDIDAVDLSIGTSTQVELTTGTVVNRSKIFIRNIGTKTVFIGPTGVGVTFTGRELKKDEETTYEYDATERLYALAKSGTGELYIEETT